MYKFFISVIIIGISFPLFAQQFQYETIKYYNQCFWVLTGPCYPETGYCEGYWHCCSEIGNQEILVADFSDGSAIKRHKIFSECEHLLSCSRSVYCPLGNYNNTCLAWVAKQNNSILPCP